ncbi:MAG: hypothetical protein OXC30_04500 [Alphaproteobacteria bacterium]|nr:hypothetical protein [Alphaproteobacteria bacterium]
MKIIFSIPNLLLCAFVLHGASRDPQSTRLIGEMLKEYKRNEFCDPLAKRIREEGDTFSLSQASDTRASELSLSFLIRQEEAIARESKQASPDGRVLMYASKEKQECIEPQKMVVDYQNLMKDDALSLGVARDPNQEEKRTD